MSVSAFADDSVPGEESVSEFDATAMYEPAVNEDGSYRLPDEIGIEELDAMFEAGNYEAIDSIFGVADGEGREASGPAITKEELSNLSRSNSDNAAIEYDLKTGEKSYAAPIASARTATTERSVEGYDPPQTFGGSYDTNDPTRDNDYRKTAYLYIIANNGRDVFYGSGFFSGYNHVVTAGHNIRSYDHGDYNNYWLDGVYIVPAKRSYDSNNGTSGPYGYSKGKWFRVGSEVLTDWSNDWGIIQMESDLGSRVGYLGVRGTTADFIGYQENVYGYRSGTFRFSYGNIYNSQPKFLESDAPTAKGMSGGPHVLSSDNDYVMAIHTAGTTDWCFGLRINDYIYDNIIERRW